MHKSKGCSHFLKWPSGADLRDDSSRMIHDAHGLLTKLSGAGVEDGLLELARDGPLEAEGAGDERVQAGSTKPERLQEVLILPPQDEPIFIEMMKEQLGLNSMQDKIAGRL
jgi:hypothetical protein